MSRSVGQPMTVTRSSAARLTARHRFAPATWCTRLDFAEVYGASSHSRRTEAVVGAAPAVASTATRSSAWRAISSCAFAESASASSGNDVDSAFASSPRTRARTRGSAPESSAGVGRRRPTAGSGGRRRASPTRCTTQPSASAPVEPAHRAPLGHERPADVPPHARVDPRQRPRGRPAARVGREDVTEQRHHACPEPAAQHLHDVARRPAPRPAAGRPRRAARGRPPRRAPRRPTGRPAAARDPRDVVRPAAAPGGELGQQRCGARDRPRPRGVGRWSGVMAPPIIVVGGLETTRGPSVPADARPRTNRGRPRTALGRPRRQSTTRRGRSPRRRCRTSRAGTARCRGARRSRGPARSAGSRATTPTPTPSPGTTAGQVAGPVVAESGRRGPGPTTAARAGSDERPAASTARAKSRSGGSAGSYP